MSLNAPEKISSTDYRFDSFENKKVLLGKKKQHLPAMGWNSWNAFGSGNTEALTKTMTDCIVKLGLDKLGYQFVILDDGCYKSERIDGKLENDEVKFPSGFRALSDYVHSKGLKFGMYNDIGTNLCAGAAVGTCGHEKTDGKSYVDWGVDFLKIDNCYFLWDNATFSNPENAKYVYAPNVKSVLVKSETANFEKRFDAVKDGILWGQGAEKKEGFVTGIGTFDGTNTGTSPVGLRSGELRFMVEAPAADKYLVYLEYATGKENGTGCWLELAVGEGEKLSVYYDNLLLETESKESFVKSTAIEVELEAGENLLRVMNHRRQENTLCAYAAMLDGLNEADENHDIFLSICEWGKTQPQNWGYKVGDSWRILNDITFRVGSDGDAGFGEWNNPGTQSVCSQYNKAVVMDEFAGLDKGWNDPDMLMIGMNGLNSVMNRTHFAMWCMMNSPLMLGMDLRRMSVGDEYYNIVTNTDLIALNQDSLGVQGKRIWTSLEGKNPEEYITDNNRYDVVAKPLSDGSVAVSVFNLSDTKAAENVKIPLKMIFEKMGDKLPDDLKKKGRFVGSLDNAAEFNASATCETDAKSDESVKYTVKDLWTKQETEISDVLIIGKVDPCDNVTVKIK